MKFLDICRDPKRAGENACKSDSSIRANPFRNTNGYIKEYVLWEEGYISVMKKKKASQKT
jgi:hypothetical protein